LIGFAFAVPFAVLVWRRLIDRALFWKLGGLFVLGGLQGAIGWWMVSSGLSERTDVSQYRLAIHLTLACLILAGLVALAVRLRGVRDAVPVRIRAGAGLLLLLALVQIFVGALVAKTGAGLSFNTWPLMDGNFIPPFEQLFPSAPYWKNFFENVMTIQFTHRMVAYGLFGLALVHAIDTQRSGPFSSALRGAVLLALVTAQAMLGIVTLLWGAPLSLSLLHQAGAVAVLVAATVHVARLKPQVARP
jgi:cytochrome c oxidase assembly protein subunit 15